MQLQVLACKILPEIYIYQLHATAVCADYISCQHAPYNQGGIELPEETELIKSTKADSAKSLRLT